MKKNAGALVLAIIGSVIAAIGAIVWAACAETVPSLTTGEIEPGVTSPYALGFLGLGLGGAVFSIIGGVQALTFKKGRIVLSFIGLALQVGNIILQCVLVGGFYVILSIWTLIAVVLLLIAAILSCKSGKPDKTDESDKSDKSES